MQDDHNKGNEKASAARDERSETLELPDGLKLVLRNGWYVLPRTGRVVTTEMIRQIQDEIDREEVERAAAFARGELP